MSSVPRCGALFAGYGGLELAVQSLFPTMRTAWVAEIGPAPSRILATRFPDTPNLGDVSTVGWDAVEPVEILTGGFPCQDVSIAGPRRGMRDGTRSGLWYQMARAIKALRPGLVVIENVRGLLSAEADGYVEPCAWCLGDSGDGEPAVRALGAVLADLAELGYDAAWCGLRAADVGTPHSRYRIFVLAWDTRRATGLEGGPALPDTDRPARSERRLAAPGQAQGRGARTDARRRGRTPAADGLTLLPTPAVNDMGAGKTIEKWDTWTDRMRAAHSNGNGHGNSLHIEALRMLPTPTTTQRGTDDSAAERPEAGPNLHNAVRDFGPYAPAIDRWENTLGRPAPAPTEPTGKAGAHRLSPRFVEWLMGLPDGWVTSTDTSRNEQLKALGNGVVPQQAAAAIRHLLKIRAQALHNDPENP